MKRVFMSGNKVKDGAMGFLYNPDKGEVLLHLRDGNTSHDPHRWCFFGGGVEEGETPSEAFIREMKEELNLDLEMSEVKPLRDYHNDQYNAHRYVFYVESNLPKVVMTLGEGAGFDWVSLDRVFSLDMTSYTKQDLEFFINNLGLV